MNRYRDILEQYNRVRQQLEELHLEYGPSGDNPKGKKRGDVFQKRKMQLLEKGQDLMKKMRNIGVHGNIVHVQGKRSRPNKKNPQILVEERFNLYFVNVDPDEVSSLVKLHVANAINYQITFIMPGKVNTTS